MSPKWVDAPEAVRDQHRRAYDRLRQEERDLLKAVFGDPDLDRREFCKPWQFDVHQEGFPFLKDDVRESLQAAKRERSQARAALAGRGLAGSDLEAALLPLVQQQEAQLREILPLDVFQKNCSEPLTGRNWALFVESRGYPHGQDPMRE